MILSSLSDKALDEEAESRTFPKWGTLCLLRKLRLPTLDGAFLAPGTSVAILEQEAAAFASVLDVGRLMVRSDGGREDGAYFRGGNTFELPIVLDLSVRLLRGGRAVILLEPTDRFRNRLTMNFLAYRDGAFVAEILGPGYDTSDLNRGGTTPQYVIRGDLGGWAEHVELGLAEVRGTCIAFAEDERRRLRLQNVGRRILPSLEGQEHGGSESYAESWLRMRGYDELWRPWTYSFDFSQVQSWYDDAFLIANHISRCRRWEVFVLSWSLLSDYRSVYWDVVEPKTKFMLPIPPRPLRRPLVERAPALLSSDLS
jgi:hypothetical protein